MKIFSNAGHAPNGIPDCGAWNKSTGLRECDIALIISEKVRYYLKLVGYDVVLFQSDSLYEICNAANESKSDLFVSIHCNSFSDPSANGTETWYHASSKNGKKLADYIQKQLVSTTKLVNRGIKTANYQVLRDTNMPAVLIETAFISNMKECAMLGDPYWQDEFAKAIARGITDYYA
jgi:N-acetylmuramoyl-L-alanine amidase